MAGSGTSTPLDLTLRVWRQKSRDAQGAIVDYPVKGISQEMSFLEMLDVLNEDLLRKGEEPITFDHDCREGICGTCNLFINGRAHGPEAGTTTCQLHMRKFKTGDTITIEPWRSAAFPLHKDLSVDRSALDRIIQAGGYVSVNTGGTPDGNEIPIPKTIADRAMSAATCIGCGACVAACPNSSAMLFTSAKVAQLALLPQGQVERKTRVENMVAQMDIEGFGHCTLYGECQEACPKAISIDTIARMNRDYIRATVSAPQAAAVEFAG